MEVQNFVQLLLLNFLQLSNAVPSYPPNESNSFSSQCKPPNFKCFDGVCIIPEWVCDGNEDCLHGEDEYCIKESSLQAKEEQQIRKRSPQHLSNFNNPTVKEDALSLIFTANEVLERGMSHIISSEPNIAKKITKRNQEIYLIEEEKDEKFSTLPTDVSATLPDSTVQITSEDPVVSSFSPSSGETEASSVGSQVSTEFTTAQVSSMITIEEETDAMSVTEDPSSVTSKSDLFQEKLMILEEIISHYLSLKDWLEEVLNNNQNTTNCPTIDQNNYTSTTEPTTTTTDSSTTTLINTTTTKEPLTITKITCPYHFQYMNGICIFVQIYPPVPWFEASALCNAQQSHLILINSKEFFEKLLKQLNFDRMRVYDFWIGATNQNSNGIWSWTDGTPIKNFDAWGFNINRNNIDLFLSYNKPNQCGFLDGKLYSYINEASCYEPKGFICQFKPKYQEIFYFSSENE